MLYEHQCEDCNNITVVARPMARRNEPYTCECGGLTERIWSRPYVTPESLYVEGSVITKGRRAILNDSDDPWETVDGLSAEQSEEFYAKSQEAKGNVALNWGDRRGKIVFDTGKKSAR